MRYKIICRICNKEFYVIKARRIIAKYCCYKCLAVSKRGNKNMLGKHHTKRSIKQISRNRKGIRAWNKGLIGFCEGTKSGHWKGGRRKRPDGYIQLTKNKYHSADKVGHILEHRFIMEQHLGRFLKLGIYGEVVHHINGVKDDNRIENLRLFSSISKHKKFHNSLN